MPETINTRADLDAIKGTEQYDRFLRFLAGTINRWRWQGGEWVLTRRSAAIARFGYAVEDFPDAPVPDKPTDNPDEQALDAARDAAIERVNNAYAVAVAPVTAGYPEAEQKTWSRQEREALAFVQDSTAECPLLRRIADQRGLTMDDLTARVLENVGVYEKIAGDTTGIRQRLESEIESAYASGDRGALEKIDWPE